MLERAMQVLDGSFHPLAPPAHGTVGWVQVEANPEIAAAARGALEKAGISLRPMTLPSLESAFTAGIAIIGAENWTAFGHLIACEALGSDVRARLLTAREITPADVQAAEKVRDAFRAEVDEALAQVDALALPTMPDFPLTLAAAADPRAALMSTSLVRQFNVSGHPALSLPVATVSGLPAGLQLVGRRHQDESLCALARTVA
jgi:amidase